MDLLEEGNEVVLAESMEFIRTFSTASRPARVRPERYSPSKRPGTTLHRSRDTYCPMCDYRAVRETLFDRIETVARILAS